MAGETNTDSSVEQTVSTEQQTVAPAEHVSAASTELVEDLKDSQSHDAAEAEVQDEVTKEAVSLKDETVEQISVVEQSTTEPVSENSAMEPTNGVQTVNGEDSTEAFASKKRSAEPVVIDEASTASETVSTEPAAVTDGTCNGKSTELPDYLYKAMEQVASGQGFTPGQYKIEFDVGSNKGDGFVGEMFKAFLTEGDRREVFLCKIPPLNEARRRQFPTMIIFSRETLAYKTLLPVMFAYQESKGVARAEGFFNVPKCYYAECDESTEQSVIIMEDLRLLDYRMWDKMRPVNYEHVKLTMQSLGRLHAVSLGLKRDRPQDFEQFKVEDPLQVVMPEGSPMEAMLLQMLKDAIETLEPHETKERTKMQKLVENMRKEMVACTDSAPAEPYTVLGHGDCWVNNFMFNYKNGAPENIILLDWQITRYVSPVLDLVYFLFCCTDEEFRRRHYDEMMNVYYNSLAALLEKLGHNPQEVFPRTVLMRQLRRYGKFGIFMAIFLVPMMCTRSEDLLDMDEAAERYRDTNEMDLNGMTMKANKQAYRTRMSAVVRDVVRYGYL